MKKFLSYSLFPAVLVFFGFIAPVVAEQTDQTASGDGVSVKSVPFFEAIDRKLIDVTLKQNNSLDGQMTVRNVSGEPL
ncbi:MAG TPA: hypothetical protein DEB39_15170, partial [Planctomycetaceae bacterium]|nr:hypothetical protein [Planctomycetaceae bacterium]